MNIDKAALDRYITGNWGENQYAYIDEEEVEAEVKRDEWMLEHNRKLADQARAVEKLYAIRENLSSAAMHLSRARDWAAELASLDQGLDMRQTLKVIDECLWDQTRVLGLRTQIDKAQAALVVLIHEREEGDETR